MVLILPTPSRLKGIFNFKLIHDKETHEQVKSLRQDSLGGKYNLISWIFITFIATEVGFFSLAISAKLVSKLEIKNVR